MFLAEYLDGNHAAPVGSDLCERTRTCSVNRVCGRLSQRQETQTTSSTLLYGVRTISIIIIIIVIIFVKIFLHYYFTFA